MDSVDVSQKMLIESLKVRHVDKVQWTRTKTQNINDCILYLAQHITESFSICGARVVSTEYHANWASYQSFQVSWMMQLARCYHVQMEKSIDGSLYETIGTAVAKLTWI